MVASKKARLRRESIFVRFSRTARAHSKQLCPSVYFVQVMQQTPLPTEYLKFKCFRRNLCHERDGVCNAFNQSN